jgi:hypothetical protein
VVAVSVEAPVPEIQTMSTSDAAEILGVSTARGRAMIRDGALFAVKAGRNNMVTTQSVKNRLSSPRKAGRQKMAVMEKNWRQVIYEL